MTNEQKLREIVGNKFDHLINEAIKKLAEKYFPIKGDEFAIDKYALLRVEEHDEFLSDLTALISEGYVSRAKVGYPKEFVEWIGDDCSPCYLERKNDDEGYGKWVVFKRNSVEHEAEFDTLDELFNYWANNEK